MSSKPISEQQAIARAEELARTEYDNVKDFEIKVEDTPTHWRINFTNPKALARGRSHHFTVSVDKSTGKAELFRGR